MLHNDVLGVAPQNIVLGVHGDKKTHTTKNPIHTHTHTKGMKKYFITKYEAK